MHPRRVMPPRRELTAQERAQYAEVMARRERIVSPEERAASLAALEDYLASGSHEQLRCAHNTHFYHLGAVFKPSD
jgi:hypothetical protein